VNYEAIALTSQIVAAVVFAAIVVWGFIRLVTPAINAATAAKNEEIAQNERRRDDAKRAVELSRSELGRAEGEARGIRERIEHDAQREAQHIVEEAKAEAERIIRNADGELARARIAARDELRIDLVEKALAEARKKATRQIDERADAALVTRFIEELERGRTR